MVVQHGLIKENNENIQKTMALNEFNMFEPVSTQ